MVIEHDSFYLRSIGHSTLGRSVQVNMQILAAAACQQRQLHMLYPPVSEECAYMHA